MAEPTASHPRWDPTWKRLAAGTLALFLVILAFLAGRVQAGDDPGLRQSPAPAPAATPDAVSTPDPSALPPAVPDADPPTTQQS